MSSHQRSDLLVAVYGEQIGSTTAARVEDLIRQSVAPARTAHSAEPRWSERSVWLITYADSYRTAGETPLRTLARTIGDHFDGIVDGVHVLPFAPSSSDGGFAVVDYDAVDKDYGGWDDVEALTAERPVMFDAVINHLSAQSPWFRSFLDDDPEFRGFFRIGDPDTDTSAVVRPRTHPLFTPFERSDGTTVYGWTTFSADQVDLDYANPDVLIRVLEVLLHYCQRGAAAIRLDAIGFLWKDEATPSIHLRPTHQLIQLMRSVIDEVAPGTILISETNVPHHENISYFGGDDEAEVHAVYQFPLPPLAAHAALTGDTSVLETWASGIDELVGPGRSFLNFLACHDGVGVRPVEALLDAAQLDLLLGATLSVGGLVSRRSLPDGSSAPYELNTTWFDLMSANPSGGELVAEDIAIERHLATHALLLALPGVAAIYGHSLTGEAGDQAAAQAHARDINRRRGIDPADLAERFAAPDSRAHRIRVGLEAMVAARRSSPAFHPTGRSEILDSPDGVFSIERRHGSHRARVVVNFSSDVVDVCGLVDGWRQLPSAADAPPVLEPRSHLWLCPDT